MKVVSLILARGGSKGIPNKNLVYINKKPLLYYSLSASLLSKVEETWVSSDSQKILSYANKLGANILKRPKKLASDKSPSEDSLLHFAKKVDFDVIVFIQPTSPLITSYDIDNALEILNQGYDSVVSFYKIKNFTKHY